MCKGKDVNRRWLNQAYQSTSKTGNYFTGTTTREVALSIANTLSMHPSFVGKIDDLLAKLIAQGVYKISNGQLISCDATPQVDKTAVRRREVNRRSARLGKQQYRDFATTLQVEIASVA